MLVIPNMRVEVTRGSIPAVLEAGGCVSYIGTGGSSVFAEGKPDHLALMIERKGIVVLGEIHKTPSYRNPVEV